MPLEDRGWAGMEKCSEMNVTGRQRHISPTPEFGIRLNRL